MVIHQYENVGRRRVLPPQISMGFVSLLSLVLVGISGCICRGGDDCKGNTAPLFVAAESRAECGLYDKDDPTHWIHVYRAVFFEAEGSDSIQSVALEFNNGTNDPHALGEMTRVEDNSCDIQGSQWTASYNYAEYPEDVRMECSRDSVKNFGVTFIATDSMGSQYRGFLDVAWVDENLTSDPCAE